MKHRTLRVNWADVIERDNGWTFDPAGWKEQP